MDPIKNDDGSVDVQLGFPPYTVLNTDFNTRMIHALDYIAEAVGVLADAKIKETNAAEQIAQRERDLARSGR